MANPITLDQAIDAVLQLPPEQQQMLVDILRHRQIEVRRQEMAQDAQASLITFRQGSFQALSVDEVISELHEAVEDTE